MKKTLSLLLALVMVIGLFPVFADENPATLTAEEAGAVLQGYGAIKGDSNGDLMIDKELKRQDAVVILTRLMGKEADALATPAMTSFTDVAIDYYKPFLAYAEAQKWVEGKGNNLFGFNDVVTVKEFSAILLRALGHDTMGENYAKVMDLAKELKLFNGAMVEENASVVRGIAFILMNNTLETAPKGESKPLKKILGYVNANTGALEVSSIKADSAKTIAVSFNREVIEEEAKDLKFVVLRGKTEIKVEAKWNNENNMVSLENKNTFAVGDYTVTVMKGEEEFAKQDIKFEQQKIAKIEIMSEDVAVNPSTGTGYVIFRVYDQYEQDITEHFLGNGVQVNIGVAGATLINKNGVITITPGVTPLLSFQQIPVTIYDVSSGISVSKTLPTASRIGAISEFKFAPEKDVVIVDGDQATTVIIPYEAIDQTGQKTTDYKLISEGLILTDTDNDGNQDNLLTSVDKITVKVQKDPKNASKAQVVARFTGTQALNLNTDLNVILTALLWNGKNSNMNILLKQANEVHTFRLSNPASVVAANDEYVDIPFEALNREGNKVTKRAHIAPKVTITGAELEENALGNAVVRVYNHNFPQYASKKGTAFNKGGIIFVTSSVLKTANFSQVQVSIQGKHEVDDLFVKDAGRSIALENGATKGYGIGEGQHIYVQDQYNRYRDLAATETLRIETRDKNKLSIVGGTAGIGSVEYKEFTKQEGGITFVAKNTTTKEDSVIVDFIVNYTDKDGNPASVKKSVTFITVPSNNITSYNFYPTAKAYVNTQNLYAPKDRDLAFAVGYHVTGNTVSGVKDVALNPGNIVKNLTIHNTQEFAVNNGLIYGIKPLENKAESKTKVTATIKHNGNVDKHEYELTGTTVLPDALDVATTGELDSDGYLYFTENQFKALDGKWLQVFKPKSIGADADKKNKADELASGLYFVVDDSYAEGSYLSRLELSFSLGQDAANTGNASVDRHGVITTSGAKVGDEYRLIASAANGVSQTVKIKVVKDVEYVQPEDKVTPIKVESVESANKPKVGEDLLVNITFNRQPEKNTAPGKEDEPKDLTKFVVGGVDIATAGGSAKINGKVVTLTIPGAKVKDALKLEVKVGLTAQNGESPTTDMAADYTVYLNEMDQKWYAASTNIVLEDTNISAVGELNYTAVVKLPFNDEIKSFDKSKITVYTREGAPINPKTAEIDKDNAKQLILNFEGIKLENNHRFKIAEDAVKNYANMGMAAEWYKLLDKSGSAHKTPIMITEVKSVTKQQMTAKFNQDPKEHATWAAEKSNFAISIEGTITESTGVSTYAEATDLLTINYLANILDNTKVNILMIKNVVDEDDNVYEFVYSATNPNGVPGDVWTLVE